MNKEQRERQQSAIVVLESDTIQEKKTNVMKSEYRPKVMNRNGYVVL